MQPQDKKCRVCETSIFLNKEGICKKCFNAEKSYRGTYKKNKDKEVRNKEMLCDYLKGVEIEEIALKNKMHKETVKELLRKFPEYKKRERSKRMERTLNKKPTHKKIPLCIKCEIRLDEEIYIDGTCYNKRHDNEWCESCFKKYHPQ